MATLVVGLTALAELCLMETNGQPELGVTVEASNGTFVVNRVLPGCLAWDAGVRPGQWVLSFDGLAVTPDTTPTEIMAAQEITVQTSAGNEITASAASALQTSNQRKVSFLAVAGIWLAIGGIVFVLASDMLAASMLLALSVTGAAALIGAIATPFGASWVLIVENMAVYWAEASILALFLVFPINRLQVWKGRYLACAGVAAALVLTGLYSWAMALDASAGEIAHYVHRLVLPADFLGAAVLAVAALFGSSSLHREARRAMGLVALGAIAGLTPLCLLSIIPQLLGLPHPVPPDVAILSIAILPVSFGAAILNQQFFGIRHFAQRGMIALTVWLGLIAIYSIALDLFPSVSVELTVLKVTGIAATFPLLQHQIRRWIERLLLNDVYNYAETLQQLAAEIAVLRDLEDIAQHVLARLTSKLDLDWTAIALRQPDAPLLYHWGEFPEDMEPSQLLTQAVTRSSDEISWHRRLGADLLPLVTEGTRIGVLAIGPKHREMNLTQEDRALIATLAPLIATALRNALLVRTLELQVAALSERESKLQALSAQLMRVQEEERRELALEIHDDPLQRAILLARALGDDPTHPQSRHWRQDIDEVIAALRAICADLRPPVLDDLGLLAGMERLVNSFRARSDLDVNLVVDTADSAPFGRLQPELEVAFYRIAQEALYNCLKHANASRVTVKLWRNCHYAGLNVVDNGKGYQTMDGRDASDIRHGSVHLGILGMRERLRPWNGDLRVQTGESGGTIVSAEVGLGGGSLDVGDN